MKYFYLIAFVLALATAYALSQTPANPSSSAQQQQQPSNSPASTMPDQPPASGDQDTPKPGQQDQEKNPSGAATTSAQSSTAGTSGATDDASLQTQIQHQLTSQNFSNVNVAVKDGVATLTGSVPSKEDRKRVKELAKNVPGVKKVSEKLDVNPKAASAAPSPSTQNTAGSIAGNAASETQEPVSSTTAPSTSTQAQQSGGVSGSTSATTTGQGMPQSSTGSVAGNQQSIGAAAGAATATESADSTELQSKISTAIKNEPTLSSSNVNVDVTADTIELSGSVPTGKEKTTARRIAQSFAGNRKVVDKITATGMGNGVNTGNPPDKNNPK